MSLGDVPFVQKGMSQAYTQERNEKGHQYILWRMAAKIHSGKHDCENHGKGKNSKQELPGTKGEGGKKSCDALGVAAWKGVACGT